MKKKMTKFEGVIINDYDNHNAVACWSKSHLNRNVIIKQAKRILRCADPFICFYHNHEEYLEDLESYRDQNYFIYFGTHGDFN